MGKATRTAKSKLGYDDAVAQLAALMPALELGASAFRRLSHEVAAAGAELRLLRERQKALQKIVDRGPGREEPERGKVDNPERADGLVAGQLEDGKAAKKLIEEGRFAGLVDADIRMSTRIGGLARIKERNEWQTLAAARYRTLWEQAQIGGAKAIDYEQVRVDTSGSAVDAVSTMGEDARREYRDAVQQLGMIGANLVQLVVCDDMSLRALARKLGKAEGGRATESLRDEVLGALDVLVRVFHIGPARGRSGIRAAGERATDWGSEQTDAAECDEAA